jgi:hypothetical protein
MPKVTKLKATQNVTPKRNLTKNNTNEDNQSKPMITIVDKTDEEYVDKSQIKKRKASTSPIKVRLKLLKAKNSDPCDIK